MIFSRNVPKEPKTVYVNQNSLHLIYQCKMFSRPRTGHCVEFIKKREGNLPKLIGHNVEGYIYDLRVNSNTNLKDLV